MSDALALPFSTVNTFVSGGYRITHVFDLQSSERYNVNSTEYDIGCVIGGGTSSLVFICPIYFRQPSDSTQTRQVFLPFFRGSDGNTGSTIAFEVSQSQIQAVQLSALCISIILFKAPSA